MSNSILLFQETSNPPPGPSLLSASQPEDGCYPNLHHEHGIPQRKGRGRFRVHDVRFSGDVWALSQPLGDVRGARNDVMLGRHDVALGRDIIN